MRKAYTYEITHTGGGWLICGNGHGNNMKRYGTVTKNNDQTFYAQRMIPAGFRSDRTYTHIGVFPSMGDAAEAVVRDYCEKYGDKIPTPDYKIEEEQDMGAEMPSIQVVYEAHVVVNIHHDGSTRAEVLIAGDGHTPYVNDAEGRTVESKTVLHNAACKAADDLLRVDSYSLPISVEVRDDDPR